MSRTLKPVLLNPEDGSTQYASSSVKRKWEDFLNIEKRNKVEESFEIESSSDDEEL